MTWKVGTLDPSIDDDRLHSLLATRIEERQRTIDIVGIRTSYIVLMWRGRCTAIAPWGEKN